MPKTFESKLQNLQQSPKTWLITGVAGFIGSNLMEILLKNNQKVIGLDNFSTGHQYNIDQVQQLISSTQWHNFRLIEGDISNLETCYKATKGVDYVLHHAALGSVPRSIVDPILTNSSNVSGFVNMLVAAKASKVKRFVYAASSSTYGDHPDLPKVEAVIGAPLSPYAVTKLVNELYADVFAKCYNFKSIGLRYFNIFGARQDPEGAYAAVIPKWVDSFLKHEEIFINGDGSTSRDFCYIDNVTQMNILAATTENPEAINQVYNVALNARISLTDLFTLIQTTLQKKKPELKTMQPIYRDFRAGDVLHSQADISKAKRLLKYQPTHTISEGMKVAIDWYINSQASTG